MKEMVLLYDAKSVEKVLVIDSLTLKQTDKGSYWLLRSRGEGYFIWEPELKQKCASGQFKAGQEARIRHTVEKFPKVLELVHHGDPSVQTNLGNSTAPASNNSENSATFMQGASKSSDAMFRCNALNNAVAALSQDKADVPVEKILAFADAFLLWLKK